MTSRKHLPWWRAHSLSIVIGFGVIVWATLYEASDPKSHIGVFYGNSIADWLGSFVTVVATKFWYEKGSVESRLPPTWRHRVPDWVEDHSLSLVLGRQLDCAVRAHRAGRPNRRGGRQHRLGVGPDSLARLVHEVPVRTRFEREPMREVSARDRLAGSMCREGLASVPPS
jgi:hypothetical protein